MNHPKTQAAIRHHSRYLAHPGNSTALLALLFWLLVQDIGGDHDSACRPAADLSTICSPRREGKEKVVKMIDVNGH